MAITKTNEFREWAGSIALGGPVQAQFFYTLLEVDSADGLIVEARSKNWSADQMLGVLRTLAPAGFEKLERMYLESKAQPKIKPASAASMPIIVPIPDAPASAASSPAAEKPTEKKKGWALPTFGFGKKKKEEPKPAAVSATPTPVIMPTPGSGFGGLGMPKPANSGPGAALGSSSMNGLGGLTPKPIGGDAPAKPLFGSSSSNGKTGVFPKDKKEKSNLAKWAALILILLIILFSIGAFVRLNSVSNSNNGFGSGVESSDSLPVPQGIETCVLPDGREGVLRYLVTPRPETVGKKGFTDPSLSVISQDPSVFEMAKVYTAIKLGQNYLVVIGSDVSVYLPIGAFVENPSTECAEVISTGSLLDDAQKATTPDVQMAYRINFSHWSGWLVTLALLAVFSFAFISMFLSGNDRFDGLLFILAVVLTMFVSLKASGDKWVFLALFVGSLLWAIQAGSKSELRQMNEQFMSQGQFKVPDSVRPLFESLTRGWGIIGGYDWTTAGLYGIVIVFGGAIDLNASPLFHIFGDQLTAVLVGGLVIAACFAMEAARRGMVEDWASFFVGITGLVDYLVFVWLFGNNPPQVTAMTPTALAVVIPLGLFILIFGINFLLQARGERMELVRDRMSDGMLFYSSMKLVAVLAYVFMFLM